LKVLENYLGLAGYAVIQASSGQEALEIIERDGCPDLVVLDVMMPRMSGYDCCRKLRETHSSNELPVLLLTAKNQVSDLVTGFDAGANDFLTKPFSRHELLSRVHTHVSLARIHQAASRFVPHEFLRFLQRDSLADVKPGDQTQKLMTVLFADVREFTTMTNRMTLQESFDFINEYLAQMEPCIRGHHGFVDKFIGDAIMALLHTSADDAIEAALAMLRQVDVWNAQRVAAGCSEPVRIGIGLHTGSLLLGTVGGSRRMEGTVISEAVNLAARVESMTKAYGTSLLVTEDTFSQLRNPGRYAHRQIDQLHFIGSTQITALHEIFEADPAASRAAKLDSRSDMERARALYLRGEFTIAAELYEGIAAANPDDGPAQRLGARCRRLADSGVAADWNGVLQIEKTRIVV
ncbi:MAG: response regulator, partial [Pseudonocardiaceae bacterium]